MSPTCLTYNPQTCGIAVNVHVSSAGVSEVVLVVAGVLVGLLILILALCLWSLLWSRPRRRRGRHGSEP